MANWFEEYEKIPVVEKANINWPLTLDFKAQSAYLVGVVKRMQEQLTTLLADDEYLSISLQCENLSKWIHQMDIMGFTSLPSTVNNLFKQEFENPNILHALQKQSFDNWKHGKRGQYKIGENCFCLYDGKIYYRSLQDRWFQVQDMEVFSFLPSFNVPADSSIIDTLNRLYKPTVYDTVYQSWLKADYNKQLPNTLFDTMEGPTTPEAYLDFSHSKIRSITNSPISLTYLIDILHLSPEAIEKAVKLPFLMARFSSKMRHENAFSVYLLRDCLSFYEMQVTLDLLDGQQTYFDQLYIGRALMTNKKRDGGHHLFIQEALFDAYLQHPDNFDAFYEVYSQTLQQYESYNPEFNTFVNEVTVYIKKHILKALENHKAVTVIDLGFQGSINLFIKYCIEHHIDSTTQVFIHMYVLAEWFKNVYKNEWTSEIYSLLTIIENLYRNEQLFTYEPHSLQDGTINVIMMDKDKQHAADTELIFNTIITMTGHKLGLL